MCSAAVVTAAIRSSRSTAAAASPAARFPWSSRPITWAAYGANALPAGRSSTLRPTRSSQLDAKLACESAATAAETDGWVT